jgi:hypothetical protein
MFRFGIRDVMWLTVVVALVVAWWLHSQRMHFYAAEGKVALQRLEQMRAAVERSGFEYLRISDSDGLVVLKQLPVERRVPRRR